jgi:nucleoside-triphosphatase
VGFSIITVDGKRGVLAHQDISNSPRVGKYGVNLHDIDHVAVPSMIPTTPDEIVVIDEIGKMECLSLLFRQTLVTVLDTKHRVIGSIAQRGDRFIQKIKARNDIMLVEVSEKNRDKLADALINTLSF